MRLRSLHPLPNEDGSCSLLYDIERCALIDVPEELAYHLAYALENGDLDEGLLGWLASEDLLTYEHSDAWQPAVGTGAARLGVFEPGGLGCVSFSGDRALCPIGSIDDGGEVELLDSLLGRLDTVSRITFHLSSREARLELGTLRRIFGSARRRAAVTGQQIDFELVADAAAITAAGVELLTRHPVRLEVRHAAAADGGRPRLGNGLRHLLKRMPEEVTLSWELSPGERLADVWLRAKQLGVRHLQITRRGSDLYGGELRRFRRDLAAVCEEMLEHLEADPNTLIYEPVARLVRRLVGQGRIPATGGSAYWGMASDGQMLPVFRPPTFSGGAGTAGPREPALGTASPEVTQAGASPCWAQQLCGPGPLTDPTWYGLAPVEPCGQDCDFWFVQAEEGLRFYRRLVEIDPDSYLGLLADRDRDTFSESFPVTSGFFELKTC